MQTHSTPILAAGGHELTLLGRLPIILETLFGDIARAKQRVWIETFIVRDDQLGQELARHLVAARERGLDVRLLYDPLGSRTTGERYFAALRERGVRVRAYRPFRMALRGEWPWPRDHARILCIDGSAYAGGIGFGDEWLPPSMGGTGWHDVCCRVRGPIVADMARAFTLRWQGADLNETPKNLLKRRGPDVTLMVDSPADKEGIYKMVRERVRRARSRVWIENAYFLPPRRLLYDLLAAGQRGVDVRVIVPRASDVPVVEYAARAEYRLWMRHGIKVYEFLPRFCHSKFALVDDDWATVGSFNLNPSSLISTNEANLFVSHRGFVRAVADLFEEDLAQSCRVTHAFLDAQPAWTRARDRSAHAALRGLEALTWTLLGTGKRLRRLAAGEPSRPSNLLESP